MSQPVGDGDVVDRHLDVLDALTLMHHRLERPLVLVQECQRADQRQVLEMIPPRSRAVVPKGQRPGVGVHDQERPEQALRILVELSHPRAVPLGQEACQRLPFPLLAMDRSRLRAILIDREHEAPVAQLRALHSIRLGREPPGRGIFPGGRDRQHPLALQELQRVAGPADPLVLGDRQELVGEIRLPEVEERLARHRRVGDPLVGRDHRQQRVHERRLPRRRGALDQHRQRLVELAGDGRQISDQRVRRLAHQPAPRDVGDDPVQQVRVGE